MIVKLLIAVTVAWVGWYLWRGPSTRSRRPEPMPPETAPLNHEAAEAREARAVLGVADDADEADIRAAHRRLITVVHPDRGGSADLTRRINAARDLLLKQRGH